MKVYPTYFFFPLVSEKTKLVVEGDEWKGTTLNSKNLYWLKNAQTAISSSDRRLMSGRKWESETLHEVWNFKGNEKDKKPKIDKFGPKVGCRMCVKSQEIAMLSDACQYPLAASPLSFSFFTRLVLCMKLAAISCSSVWSEMSLVFLFKVGLAIVSVANYSNKWILLRFK